MLRVLCAMSGGVDSSVAAALLLEQGHDVVGVTMRLWGGESDSGCCSASDVDDARRVARALGIDHHVFAFAEEFREHVVDPYVTDHAAGRTPNPCIECNRHLKFDRLLRRAEALGFDAVATGHHARVATRADGTLAIARGADAAKDQSYVLHMLDQAALRRVLLPVGDRTKADVRAEATRLGLRTASKPDSQEVCFVTSTAGRAGFLGERLATHPAVVVDQAGHPVGGVAAVELVTIGQRRGLGGAGGGAEPRYVTAVDVPGRRVTVGPEEALRAGEVRLTATAWASSSPSASEPVTAQCSAHGAARPARYDPATGTLRWEQPQRRVAPGQAVVLYDGDVVLGGGTAEA